MRKTLISTALLALATFVAAPAVQAKDWKTVTIGLEGAYEPWNLTKPDGTMDGFEIDLANDLCGRMKVECKFIAQDWDGMIAGLNAGKFDVIMDAMSITPEPVVKNRAPSMCRWESLTTCRSKSPMSVRIFSRSPLRPTLMNCPSPIIAPCSPSQAYATGCACC